MTPHAGGEFYGSAAQFQLAGVEVDAPFVALVGGQADAVEDAARAAVHYFLHFGFAATVACGDDDHFLAGAWGQLA